MKKKLYIFAMLAAALAGCSDNSQTPAVSADNKETAKKPAKNRVVITVNGRELRQTNLAERVEMFVKVSTLANPNMTLNEVQRLRKKIRAIMPKMFKREVVLEDFLKSEKLTVAPETLEKAKKGIVASFRGRLTYDGLRRKVGPALAGILDGFAASQATEITVRRRILEKNPLELAPDYAEKQLALIAKYNAEMALTNAIVYARATNTWEKLKSGADFRAVAREFSEVPREAREGGDWGTLGLQQLEPDEELAKWAQQLQPGEFSPPIEGDNGLMILRVDSKKGEDYALSRIYFRLPMFKEVVSKEELLKLKKQQHDRAVLDKEIKALLKSADVERPKKRKKAGAKRVRRQDRPVAAQPAGKQSANRQSDGKKSVAGKQGTKKAEAENGAKRK